MAQPVFGRLITAMVTPFKPSGAVDYQEARRLAAYLVDEQRNDALVVNGTTGESPTTSDSEKLSLVTAVLDEVGDRAQVIAGVGSPDTEHTIQLGIKSAHTGAHGLLVVCPYYSRPTQEGVYAHFEAVADKTEAPIMIYDIPKRTGTAVSDEVLIKLATHENIVAVKDAKGDLAASGTVIANSDLAYYAGDDSMILPLMSVGGVGVVGTSTHFSGRRTKQLLTHILDHNWPRVRELYQELLPVYRGVFATQGVMLVKGALAARGWATETLRLPIVPASKEQVDTFLKILDAAGM
ncbi:MAG: 4-hydroxy-tetrahydrodipicolinate synthase [Propionibacteriaceae bacterium]|jgi:4-hydroxy-tetrahydrodipicolinate synthase|nr:4-hydroxy-tetrahydrodipicolinate synthase [Propionibacteriaceae bacterium]